MGVEVASWLILLPKFTELGERSVRLEPAGNGDWTLSAKIILTSNVSLWTGTFTEASLLVLADLTDLARWLLVLGLNTRGGPDLAFKSVLENDEKSTSSELSSSSGKETSEKFWFFARISHFFSVLFGRLLNNWSKGSKFSFLSVIVNLSNRLSSWSASFLESLSDWGRRREAGFLGCRRTGFGPSNESSLKIFSFLLKDTYKISKNLKNCRKHPKHLSTWSNRFVAGAEIVFLL